MHRQIFIYQNYLFENQNKVRRKLHHENVNLNFLGYRENDNNWDIPYNSVGELNA